MESRRGDDAEAVGGVGYVKTWAGELAVVDDVPSTTMVAPSLRVTTIGS